MAKNVKLTKIVVQMGDDEQALTIEQAKQLHEQLAELFGKPVQVTGPVIIRDHYPDYWWRRPWWETPTYPMVTWSGTSGLTLQANPETLEASANLCISN